jgi:hypothetical protein
VNTFQRVGVRLFMPTRIDLYTKSILTVIAVCLVLLAARSLQDPPRVAAFQQDALRVVVVGFDPQTLTRGLPVNVVGSGENAAVPVMFSGGGRDGNMAVPVNLVNAAVPIAVNGLGQEGKPPVSINVVQVGSHNVGNTGVPVIWSPQGDAAPKPAPAPARSK